MWLTAERMAADGSVVGPLNEASGIAAGEQLAAAGIEAVAICLINSYRNAAHEQRAEAILRQRWPELLVRPPTPCYRSARNTSVPARPW